VQIRGHDDIGDRRHYHGRISRKHINQRHHIVDLIGQAEKRCGESSAQGRSDCGIIPGLGFWRVNCRFRLATPDAPYY